MALSKSEKAKNRKEFLAIPGVQQKLDEIAKNHGFNVNDLIDTIEFETGGSFDPAQKSGASNAVGLIQFMPKTIKGLNPELDSTAVANMSVLEQLDLTNQYFSSQPDSVYTNNPHPYLVVASPKLASMGKDEILYKAGSKEAKANPSWQDENGNVTPNSVLSGTGMNVTVTSNTDTPINNMIKNVKENKDLLQKVKGDGRFRWSNEFGGFIPEKEYNEKLNAGQIVAKDPFYYNYFNDREKTLIKNFNSIDNAKDKLTVDENIFAGARNKVYNKYAFDENGKERYGMKVNGKQLTDEQGAKLFTQDLYNQFAEDLGYDPENLQGYQKIHVSRYMSDFKKEITLAREGKYGPAGNMGINSYLSRLNIPARGIDPFLEDIVEDKNFSEIYDRNYTDDWSELKNVLNDESKYINKYKDLQGKSSKEIQKLIDNVPQVDTNLYGPTTKEYKQKVNERNKHIAYLKNIQNFNQNNPNAYSEYVKEGELKVVDVENVEDLTQEQIEGRRAEQTYDIQKELDKKIILEEIGEEEESVEDDIIDKDGSVVAKDTDTSLPDIVVERGLLDTIGGIGTAISALVGAKALKAANNPIETIDTPELSDAFKAELYQQEQMAKRGFSPEQEAQARQQISDAYSLGIENAVRGTAGDRAKFLAMSGVLDSRRQAALLDFAAKDEAAMRANQEQYRNTLMFKENFDQQQAQQLRNEELEIMQNQYSTNQMLGSQALKYAMDNINNAKADRMQNTLTQVMINDAAAGQNIVEKYNTGGLLGKFGKTVSGLLGMNNSENNTEDNGN